MSEAGSNEASGAQTIQWSGLSDVGRFRKNNQDAFLALALNAEGVRRLGKYGEAELNESDYIYAVSDGMGGANAGEFASQIAVEKITQPFNPPPETTARWAHRNHGNDHFLGPGRSVTFPACDQYQLMVEDFVAAVNEGRSADLAEARDLVHILSSIVNA